MSKFVLGGEPFDLEKEDVLKSMKNVVPGPIRKYAIRIHGHKYPVKQCVALAVTEKLRKTKSDNEFTFEVAQFTAHDAYRVLKKLGFDIIVEEL